MVVMMVMVRSLLGVDDRRGRVMRGYGQDKLAVWRLLLDMMSVMMLGMLTTLIKLVLMVSVLPRTKTSNPDGISHTILVRTPFFAYSLVPVTTTTTRR
ncbi:hypothetical protein BC830DRAFT_1143925 [Chytriomyces sp. MP71]|nr:hypothetical protein BC830DRAFT_1143925 [Chytriomyces sp. MP71]